MFPSLASKIETLSSYGKWLTLWPQANIPILYTSRTHSVLLIQATRYLMYTTRGRIQPREQKTKINKSILSPEDKLQCYKAKGSILPWVSANYFQPSSCNTRRWRIRCPSIYSRCTFAFESTKKKKPKLSTLRIFFNSLLFFVKHIFLPNGFPLLHIMVL